MNYSFPKDHPSIKSISTFDDQPKEQGRFSNRKDVLIKTLIRSLKPLFVEEIISIKREMNESKSNKNHLNLLLDVRFKSLTTYLNQN